MFSFKSKTCTFPSLVTAENTVDDFVENLCKVFDEIHRILKPTGSCWVNIGDTYDKKRLLQVPSRFEIAMCDRGWHLRNEIIWSKPNPQPISSKDRFWSNHEKFFWFVKDVKKYYFNRDAILVPQAEISIRRMFSKNNMNKRKDFNASSKEGFSISSESQDKHYARMREEIGVSKDFNYQELIRSGKCPMRPEFDTWDIPSVTYKGAHFAVYPPELIEKPILSCCPEQGIVIDPFMGSGTTAMVAKSKGKSAFAWFVYGLLLWPIALTHALLSKAENDQPAENPATLDQADLRECPFCAEQIKAKARFIV